MTQPARHISLEELLELDKGDVKHEYIGGVAYAMAGCTLEHAAIAENVDDHHSHRRRAPGTGGGRRRARREDRSSVGL